MQWFLKQDTKSKKNEEKTDKLGFTKIKNFRASNNPIEKGKGFEQSFIQRRYTNGQQAYEKMLSIISHQGNANQTTMK